ncbi:MAG: right-handed parallel beta-helix repeat-containing protein [Halarchaeum sp.]
MSTPAVVAPTVDAPARASVRDVQRNVVNVLEVRATGSGDYDYAFTVRGSVQRTRVTDGIKSESTDVVRDEGDGTVTVRGSTGNEQSDAFLYRGRVVSFRKTGGDSGGTLVRNGLSTSVDDLTSAHVLEVVSRDRNAEVGYAFTVSGSVEKASADGHSADDDDRITTRDGTATVRGSTGDQSGDAYRVTGTITDFRKTGGDSAYFLRYDGLAFTPAEFGAANGDGGGDGSDVTPVEGCTVIDRPGAYALTRDVRNSDAETCIRIAANRVTFDGNGHLVDGVDAEDSVGVDVAPAERSSTLRRVVVRNVRTSDWGTGVNAGDTRTSRAVRNLTVSGVTSTSNTERGVRLSDVTGSVLSDASARGNGLTGVYLEELGSDNVVRNVDASANRIGIVAFEGGNGLVLRNNRVRDNDHYGIDTTNGDRDVAIVGNAVVGNGRSGMDLDESSGITVRDNAVRDNGGSGIDFEDVGRIDAVAGNTVRDNGAYGVVLKAAGPTVVRDNVVRENARNGVALLDRSRGVAVRENTVCGNADPQIRVGDDVENASVSDNRVTCR